MSIQELQQISLEQYDQMVEAYFERGQTDGFPVIPSYPEGIDAMVAATGRSADEQIGSFTPTSAPVTIRDVAEQALMAGCLPAYMPVVLAVFEILLEPGFETDRWARSTGGYFPWVIVNGPIRAAININCKHNVMGQGFRPNATIGRTVRLGLINLGGYVPGTTDRSTIGTAFKFTAVVGEDEEGNPWAPLHTDLGFERDDSTVTVMVGRHARHFTHQLSLEPEHLLLSYGEELTTAGQFSYPEDDPDDPLYGLTEEEAQHKRGGVIFLAEDHRGYFADAGWSKQRMRAFLQQMTGKYVRDLRAAGVDERAGRLADLADASWVPLCASSDQFLVVCAGSGGGRAMPGLIFGKPVTRRVTEAIDAPPLADTESSPTAPHVLTVNKYFERGLTDGHPIVPPTSARVQAMIQASGRPAEDVLRSKWTYVDATTTVKDLAVNAVMAGCKPEYMPLVIAAFSVVPSLGASTGAHNRLLVVNGPIRGRYTWTTSSLTHPGRSRLRSTDWPQACPIFKASASVFSTTPRPNADRFLQMVAEELQELYGVAEWRMLTKDNLGSPARPEILQDLVRDSDFVITGIGD